MMNEQYDAGPPFDFGLAWVQGGSNPFPASIMVPPHFTALEISPASEVDKVLVRLGGDEFLLTVGTVIPFTGVAGNMDLVPQSEGSVYGSYPAPDESLIIPQLGRPRHARLLFRAHRAPLFVPAQRLARAQYRVVTAANAVGVAAAAVDMIPVYGRRKATFIFVNTGANACTIQLYAANKDAAGTVRAAIGGGTPVGAGASNVVTLDNATPDEAFPLCHYIEIEAATAAGTTTLQVWTTVE